LGAKEQQKRLIDALERRKLGLLGAVEGVAGCFKIGNVGLPLCLAGSNRSDCGEIGRVY
jgi:hypothetical protein